MEHVPIDSVAIAEEIERCAVIRARVHDLLRDLLPETGPQRM